jgi:hypothetical protein
MSQIEWLMNLMVQISQMEVQINESNILWNGSNGIQMCQILNSKIMVNQLLLKYIYFLD